MTQDPQTRPARSRLRRYLPGLLFLVVLGVAVYLIWRLVFASSAAPENVITLSGRIEGDPAAVAAKLNGRILEIRVREGDIVKSGDVIAVLDDEQVRAREDQARAAGADAFLHYDQWLRIGSVVEEHRRQAEETDASENISA